MYKYQYIKYLILLLIYIGIGGEIQGQIAQTINPTGGASSSFNDGLKIVVNTTGSLAVYRANLAQYCCSHNYPSGSTGGVALTFRSSRVNGSTTEYNSSANQWTACSTTAAVQTGNVWTTSISGYFISRLSQKKFYVTMNFKYTHPDKYFLVDYYVRAPHDLAIPETVHIYLDHDANIKGSDGSRGYMVTNTTGHYVGNYRTASDNSSTCARYSSGVSPSAHGFKTIGGFRSYYSGAYSSRNGLNAQLQLSNTVQTVSCIDDGVAVEFTIGPLSAGQIGAKQVMHAYGDNQTEFNNIAMADPTPPSGLSSPVTVNFSSATFSEDEGNNTHVATTAKIIVGGGRLAQDQVCNFTVSGGTATANTDYSYVKGFIIPAGDYTTAKTLTLNNISIIGNTTCQNNRTFNISIDTEACNDLIQPGTIKNAVFTIIDDDTPTVNQPASQIYCSGASVPANTFVFSGSTLPNTTYSWTSNTNIGFGTSGSGNIPAFTTTSNNTNAPIVATITVTPKQGTCSGTPVTFTITVNPIAKVNTITDQTVCNGTSMSAITFGTPTTPANLVTYSWTNNNTAIGLAASGSGASLPAFTATNSSNAPVTASITVTPKYNNSCTGASMTFSITVNPTAKVNTIANQTVCNGTSMPAITFGTPTTPANLVTYSWTNDQPGIGIAAAGTTSSIPAFTATNNSNSPVTASITVTPKYNNSCTGAPMTFSVTVNPTAKVNTIANQTVCNGTSMPAITFGTPTTPANLVTYSWTNDQPGIGIAAAGTTSSIPAFTAINNSNSPVTASITVTPKYNNSCTGAPMTFSITVNPTAKVNTIANQTVCNGTSMPAITFGTPTTPANLVTYSWTNDQPGIGIAAAGTTSSIPAFTATNNSNSPVTATITVTPEYDNSCTGAPMTFSITVNPIAKVNTITDQTVCNGTSMPAITFGTPTTPANLVTYSWTNNNMAIGLAASGSGASLPAFTATNNSNSPVTASITVTPEYDNSCIGVPMTFNITVNPTAKVNTIANQTVCNGTSMPAIAFGTPTTPANLVTYSWTNDQPGIGIAAAGTTSSIPAFTATNNGTAPVTATITVTPEYDNSCIGTPVTFRITVNPTPMVNTIADRTVCNGNSIPAITFGTPTTPANLVTYSWTNDQPGIGIAAAGTTSSIPAFTATNNGTAPVTATITVTPEYDNSCTGPTMTFRITVNAPVIAGTIKGNPFVCGNQNPLEIKEITAASGGSNSFTYQWKSSIDGVIWTDISGANSTSYTPGHLSVDTHFKRITIDGFCGQQFESNVFTIKVMAQPTALYWKSTAGDSNWNNPDNWVDKEGNQLGMVPLACTDVQITGGSANYPSLDLSSTPVDIYGIPQCRNITFQYGAEVAFQHKLTYEKAFVQYNWGYYSNTSGLADGTQPDQNGSGDPCLVKERDVWYALAAPLKNMASGDFSFGGFPVTWQGGFNIQDPVTGESVGVEAGDFGKAYARNDINLTETNNAVAIKVPSFKNQVGLDNHCHMDALKGILEFPYFENSTQSPYHPAHTYDKFTGESKFFYFDTKTLQLIYSPVGRMKRGAESYRFVYETSSNGVTNINVGGNSVPGYAQQVTKHIASSQRIMIGNPFMSSINSKRFLDANNISTPKILASDGYYVFNSTTQTWEHLPFSATNNIKPQQAFIVTLADGVSNTELLYPFEGAFALTGPTFRGRSLVVPEGNSLYLKTSDSNDKAGDYAILNASQSDENLNNVRKMIYTEGHVVPETFFITPNGKDYNLVQALEDDVHEIGIGVKCSDIQKQLKFTFDNVSEFYSAYGFRPVLVDKFMAIEQDLTDNSTYHFHQRKTTAENRYIDADRFVLRLASSGDIIGDASDDIRIIYQNHVLDVKSSRVIKSVLVYDLYGRLIHSGKQINSTVYTKPLSLAQGLYIVKVQTEDGKTKVEKIMAL
ncbi:PKD-like domain-containing protein [Dysgonomonas termitidis]|uniref:PKD-like domain-containing protein n=1 Tax=Dysgonomonas termitidis TaxID=1516126 RepID=A0ABV9KUX5_9BACT